MKTGKNLFRDRKGAAVLIVGLTMPLLVGAIGFGLEVGYWYYKKDRLQNAADAAAITAGLDLSKGYDTSSIETSVTDVATRNGFDGESGTLTLNIPPTSGTATGSDKAAEVILTQDIPRLVVDLFLGPGSTTLKVRSVSKIVDSEGGSSSSSSGATGCILALDSSMQKAIDIGGNPAINAPNCIFIANSSNDAAIEIYGSASGTIGEIYTAGGYQNSTSLTVSKATTKGSSVSDPYASVSVPSAGSCTQTNYKVNSNQAKSLTPGTYCSGLTIHGTASFSSGTYIIKGGAFTINSQAVVSGSGVTFVLTDNATLTINGGATVSLTAPTSGSLSGLAFFENPSAPGSSCAKINGGSTMVVTGALYFRNNCVQFAGNTSGSSSCTQVVADSISFKGNSGFGTSCTNAGVKTFSVTTTSITLVE
jgi:Flp pilus assembly protein TadG